jgi:hypothetical protein
MFNERCCTEPSLDELFGDVAMRLLMRRDGVTESDIRTLLCEMKGARAVALRSAGPALPVGGSVHDNLPGFTRLHSAWRAVQHK